jgi:hypothetical protein
MPINQVQFNSLFIVNSILLFKIGVLVFSFLYFIFTLVVIRQVGLMTETVRTQAAPILKLVSFLYALFALGVVVFFFLTL